MEEDTLGRLLAFMGVCVHPYTHVRKPPYNTHKTHMDINEN